MCFYRWFVQPTHLCVAHSELHNVLEVFNSFHMGHVVWGMGGGVLVSGARVVDEVSEEDGVIWVQGSHSLGEKAVEQSGGAGSDAPVRLPDGRSWKRLWEGFVGSFTMLVALLEHRARKMSRMDGRGAPMIFAAVFTVCCRQGRS